MESKDKLQNQYENLIEWHNNRKKGIGGSSVGAILGLSKYSDAYTEYWYYKTPSEELANEEQSEAAYFGSIMENLVVSEFEKRNGKKVTITDEHFHHPKNEWAVGNVDGLIPEEKAIVECKTVSEYLKSEWVGEDAPACYICQVQWYMYVLGYEKAYLCAIVGGNKWVQHEIQRDDELIEMIVDKVSDFWYNNVMKDIPPHITGSNACSKLLDEKYSKCTKEDLKPLTRDFRAKLEELKSLKDTKKLLEDNIRLIENELKEYIGEEQGAYIDNTEVYWKNTTTKRFDSTRFKKENKELYEKYVNETNSRRFSIKERNE